MAIISMKSRKEAVLAQKKKYQKSTKKVKKAILDNLYEVTKLNREHISRILRTKEQPRKIFAPEKRGRKPIYDHSFQKELKRIWIIMDCACGKRIAAGMNTIVNSLLNHDELKCDEDTIKRLKEVSPSTIDRLLSYSKKQLTGKGIPTTKPGTLLKKNIPIRIGTDWEENCPGFVEMDLVAHCGSTTAGDYINTLDVTDISSGWTETQAVINKAQKHVFEALLQIKRQLPFALLGIDSDNGSEFINHQLYKYCVEENICFTRSRPNQKNDGCYVEQKNWNIVRRHMGYARYESPESLKIMNDYYKLLRLHTNFFLPSLKLETKTRDGAKIKKTYEVPQTPYQRLLASEYIDDKEKEALRKIFEKINPAQIKRDIIELQKKLLKTCIPYEKIQSKM
jgi:hypothetical protein